MLNTYPSKQDEPYNISEWNLVSGNKVKRIDYTNKPSRLPTIRR